MKRLKTYQQLFESIKFQGTRFGHNQYQDFIDDDGNLVDKYGEPLD